MNFAIYVFDGISMFHAAAPLSVFGEAAKLPAASDWTLTVWSDTGSPVRTAEGVELAALSGPEALDVADVVVIPSWHSDFRPVEGWFREGVSRAHTNGAQVVGLCLGAFPLAASGILDGRAAVTHWSGAEELARSFPRVQVAADALYMDHGDVLTSAGTASGLDACLHFVRTQLGAEHAAAVAQKLVIAPHRDGGQAQYFRRPMPTPSEHGPMSDLLEWIVANLEHSLTVETLAARTQMSTRNFTRRFREATGTSPARWIAARRLDEGRRLLETTGWTIDRIARTCGFASPVTFRQSFAAAFSTTPTSYRKRFSHAA